ncbi:MAG: PDZ domain-containing protein [Planctomycetes bacterium]|nr:PDZ domain-containing protein [Planctomycetota bacterium]
MKPLQFLAVVLVASCCDWRLSIAQDDVNLLEEQGFRAAVDRVAPSVVQIETLGGLERVGEVLVGSGPTTGLVVSEDGYILSSAFNFIQKPTSILVSLPGGERAAAEIVARDESRMLVLLKVNAEAPLPVPEFVPREEMQVGQWTIAVGRAFQSDQPNVSTGVLSAANRIWGKAIQTDARVSPVNYGGPLIDIRGRVLGVLAPLSPQQQGEVAGAEWYDSGIGFAVPVTDLLPRLEQLKAGEDLHPGILGVSIKGKDQFADPVIIGAVQPKSPAAEAGLKVDDEIVEAGGRPIVRHVQLKHVIGRKYAGDTLELVVKRGDERVETEAVLAAKLEPYVHPFLGVLPMREAGDEKGVAVRYVYPASPAAEVGIVEGDRLVSLDGEEIADAAALREKFANLEPGAKVKIGFVDEDEEKETEVTLAKLPEEVPGELPPAHGEVEAPEQAPVTGEVAIKLPEEPNDCVAYVPPTYNPQTPHGVVIWLHKPGAFDKDALLERWKQPCEDFDLILLAPQSADPARWLPTEVEFIRKAFDDLAGRYAIDPQRVVVHGHDAGGAMALLTAFANREVIRGAAAVEAAIPSRVTPPANDPLERMALYFTTAAGSQLKERVKEQAEQLREMGYPVTVHDLGAQPRYLNDDEVHELARWVDSLDHL